MSALNAEEDMMERGEATGPTVITISRSEVTTAALRPSPTKESSISEIASSKDYHEAATLHPFLT